MRIGTDEFIRYVHALPCTEEEKNVLLAHARSFEKELHRSDFQMNRTLKDKSIVINLLNKTIEDLSSQQVIVEQANQELSRQKREIEEKNAELERQKSLVEEQSKKLAENLHQLELSYNELEQFSYIASHDLKSPLRNIASYAGLLKRRYYDAIDKDTNEFIDFIVKGANHMNDIIRDLLEYSKSGREKVFEKINLNDTLELVKFNLRQEIIENEAVIKYDTLPELYVHKSGMLQLFQNLIANAIKFRGETNPVISIDHRGNEEVWEFRVSDNGLGLDTAFQEKAFLPFQRINHLERPGTGMGLAICKKIVSMHKGKIWYHSKIGQGTTFNFTICQEQWE